MSTMLAVVGLASVGTSALASQADTVSMLQSKQHVEQRGRPQRYRPPRRYRGRYIPQEGPLTGVQPGLEKPKLIFGVDADYPPYAYTTIPETWDNNTDNDEVIGVGPDMIRGMAEFCDFEVSVVRAHWSDCWGNGEIGEGLLQGWYHGCMTYTHPAGIRNQYLEFSTSWAVPNKPGGLIVKLDENGKPKFDGNDNLNGRTIVDVTGWAPTADTLHFVVNQCTDKPFENFTIVQGDDLEKMFQANDESYDPHRANYAHGANDRALLAVLDDRVDAMWIYGDQAENYHCKDGDKHDGWNCDLWKGFGTKFAYIQSGLYGWLREGTTIAMAKKGSGIKEFLDPCFEQFQKTEAFYKICAKNHGYDPPHNQLQVCQPNEYFQDDPHYKPWDVKETPWLFATKEHSTECHSGYCKCPAAQM